MKKLLVVSGLVLVVFIAAVSETSAQTIYSCYNTKSGAMRYVTGPNACKRTEHLLSWSSSVVPGFDVSRLYTISQQYKAASCLNDDVSISCSAYCEKAPNSTNLYGVLETVENSPFGADPATHVLYTYDDHQPGSCQAWCAVTYSTDNLPQDYGSTYLAGIITVLCLPRQ